MDKFPNVVGHQYRAQAQRVRCNEQVIVANEPALPLQPGTDTTIVPADILTQRFDQQQARKCVELLPPLEKKAKTPIKNQKGPWVS